MLCFAPNRSQHVVRSCSVWLVAEKSKLLIIFVKQVFLLPSLSSTANSRLCPRLQYQTSPHLAGIVPRFADVVLCFEIDTCADVTLSRIARFSTQANHFPIGTSQSCREHTRRRFPCRQFTFRCISLNGERSLRSCRK